MCFDAPSEISENHIAGNDQSMHYVSNFLLYGSDLGNESDLNAQWFDAAASGNVAEIRRLIHLAANLNAENIDSDTYFILAAWCGDKRGRKLFLELCAAFEALNYSPSALLHYAAENGHKEIVHLLLNDDASFDSKNDNLETTPNLSAFNIHQEVVNLLLHDHLALDARNEDYSTALHIAAKNGHMEVIALLLDFGAAVDDRDDNNATALHLAAEKGHTEIIQLLLNSSASVDAKDGFSNTSLHLAAKMGHKEVVALLLNHGAEVDAQNYLSVTALHYAAEERHTEIIKLLLDSTASIDAKKGYLNTLIHLAARMGHMEVIALLLDFGAAVDDRDDNNATALHLAAEKGHTEIIQLLLNSSASVDAKDGFSNTPLHLAARMGHKEVVALLLNHGAEVDARNHLSVTALHYAAEEGHTKIVKLLLNSSASIDAKEKYLNTALHLAAVMGHKEVVSLLLCCRAAVDARNDDSATVLHLAAGKGHTEIVKMLLNYGAFLHAKKVDLNTVLHLAARMGHKEVVSLLLDCGAEVDARDYFSATALHLAAEKGHTEIVQMLLYYGASVDSKNDNSKTALHHAAELGHHKIVHLLLNHSANTDVKDNNSKTPLHLAVRNEDKHITSQLLDSCVNIDEKSNEGNTLLAEVSEYGDIEMAALLLKHGADKEAIDLNGRTCLIIAVIAAERSMVSFLIKKGSHIDASDNDSLTALHWSAKDGHLSILELLLQYMANTEARSKDGNTALHIAVEFNRTNIVAVLIDNKANVNAENGDGKSPIEVAITKGHIEIVFQLKDAGAKMGDNGEETLWLLYLAAEAGQVFLIKSILDKVDEEKKQIYMDATLHEASRYGQVDVVACLLEHGAEIESLNDDGLTPLFLAGQYSDVISLLIHHGACINVRNQNLPHQGVLHYYASLNQVEGVRLLLNCDYNIHIRDNDYLTALHYVARESKEVCEIAGILLRQGVDVNAKDHNGHTALHYCSEHDSLELAKLLIDFGIDIDATNFLHGATALHWAIKRRNLNLISLLLKHRADVNARDRYRETGLNMAVIRNFTAECALLLEYGANVNPSYNLLNDPLYNAAKNYNPSLVKLLLDHGASINPYLLENIITPYELKNGYNLCRRYLYTVTLLVEAGASCTGMKETMAQLEEKFSTLRKFSTDPSYRQLKSRFEMAPETSIAHIREKNVHNNNEYHRHYRPDSADDAESRSKRGIRDEVRIPLKDVINTDIYGYKVDTCNEKRLVETKHKYGTGFPCVKRLHLDEDEVVKNQQGNDIALGTASSAQPMKLFGAISIDDCAMNITQSLLNCLGARFFASDHYFMLELDPCVEVLPPRWASHFDKMQGIIRETGLLIVQAPPKRSSWSIPAWYNGSNPYLRFIDAVYTCRRSCFRIGQEAFSDVLGGSEQKLATNLHATLIAGLSILSIADGEGLVDTLVMAILGIQLPPIQNLPPSSSVRKDWQVRNRRHCPCGTGSIHRPLSPVAAAKAVGIDIWRERSDDIVNRVWDLQDDTLVKNVDVRKIVFITHRWDTSEISPEIDYQTVMENKSHSISLLSTKLNRIKTALMKKDIRYVWIDTICIDKANLSELDEAIRSMYKWYASCAAVVLDSGTPLDIWCSRGWCLQEGVAAGLLCGISKDGNLATIQQLATEQKENLCTLDLHLYYRPGNAVEILTRMDVRKTTRKEDMAYALAGIFSIDLTLAYGEGLRSRTRLLEQLAIQKGDLSFLSFHTTQKMLHNSLPAIGETHHLIANCTIASAPVIVSHFGICFEVQLVKAEDAKRLLQKLKVWSEFSFAKGRFSGVEELIKAAGQPEHQNSSSVEIAIVHDISSLILVQVYGYDRQTGGGKAIKRCYRLQCCQIEETEFERLLIWHVDESKKSAAVEEETKRDDSSPAKVASEVDLKNGTTLERIWLGDKPDGAELTSFRSESTERYGRSRQRIL